MNKISSTKPYQLTFLEQHEYLHAFVEGERDTYDISRAYWQEIADRVSEVGASRVLIEENIEEPGSFADVFRLASEIPTMGFGRARIAFFDRYLDHNEINEFGELVAVNRGVNGAIFNDLETAVQWLMSGQ